MHACFRRIRAMVEDGTQSNEREALERGHDAGGERNDDAAAAEGVADRLFVALDVNNAGEVDLRELASGVSVRSTRIACAHCLHKWETQVDGAVLFWLGPEQCSCAVVVFDGYLL